MARSVRYVPEGGALVEVTVRTIQSRLLLRPRPALNERVIGVLGRAQRLYGVRCSCVAFASNHWHGLLQVDDAEQLSRFMQYVDSNVAREVGALVKWKGPFWARRYSAIVVSDEEKAQVDRLRYILAHGPKENLVERVLDWPGVHAAKAILEDKPLTGYWFDRTQEYAARNRGEEYSRLAYATEETFALTRLPCWEHLSPEEYRQRVADSGELCPEERLEAPGGEFGAADRSPRSLSSLQNTLATDVGRQPRGLRTGDLPLCRRGYALLLFQSSDTLSGYALSRSSGEPLLFKGDDFSKTDAVRVQT